MGGRTVAVKSPTSPRIDHEILTPIVRRILDDPVAELTSFQCRAMTGGFGLDTAIYQVSGNASAANRILPWRAILKILRPVAGQDDPQSFLYWPREALAYRSGMLYNLPGKLTAPRCYQVSELPGGEIWLWLEYVEDDVGKDWPLEHYGQVARQLGIFNGAYLTGCSLPDQPWIPRNWLRDNIEKAGLAMCFLRDQPAHPVSRRFSVFARFMMIMVWEERRRIFKLLDAMPQVFCHQDAFKGNLFSQGDRLVGIDWALMGIAPLGAEVVPLVLASMSAAGFPVSQARKLERVVFDGYLAGLAEAGCHVYHQDIRRAFCLVLMLRYVIGVTGQGIPVLLDQERVQQLEEKSGVTIAEMNKGTHELLGYYTSISLEGLRSLGLGTLAGMIGREAWRALLRRLRRRAS